jgi:hypothetical protein
LDRLQHLWQRFEVVGRETDKANAAMNQGLRQFREVVEVMEIQRLRKRESIREILRKSSIPTPQKIVDDIAFLNFEDALDVLTVHPGFKIWQRLKSYRAAYAIYERSMHDLFDAIDEFAEGMRIKGAFSKENRLKHDGGELRVHKELFAAGNAAHSLKDHASYRL